MVRKRRFSLKKRRVSDAETSFSDSKDGVFSEENAVFLVRGLLLSSEKYGFGRKQARNRRKIPQTYLFYILVLLLGKWGYCISDFVNRSNNTGNCFLTVSGSER